MSNLRLNQTKENPPQIGSYWGLWLSLWDEWVKWNVSAVILVSLQYVALDGFTSPHWGTLPSKLDFLAQLSKTLPTGLDFL